MMGRIWGREAVAEERGCRKSAAEDVVIVKILRKMWLLRKGAASGKTQRKIRTAESERKLSKRSD